VKQFSGEWPLTDNKYQRENVQREILGAADLFCFGEHLQTYVIAHIRFNK
jgi:hypothetical protein